MADEIPAYPYVPSYLLLPLPLPIPTTTPTITPTPSLTYYHGRPQQFWKGGGQGVPFDSQILLWRVLSAFGRFSQGGGGGGGGGCAHVLTNTEYLNVLLEVGGGHGPPGDAHDLLSLLLPLPTTTTTTPLTYYYPYYLLSPLLSP